MSLPAETTMAESFTSELSEPKLQEKLFTYIFQSVEAVPRLRNYAIQHQKHAHAPRRQRETMWVHLGVCGKCQEAS